LIATLQHCFRLTTKQLYMKKLLPIVFGFTLLMAACSKTSTCSTCVVKDGATVIKNYDQKCGTTTDVDNYEASSKEDAAQLKGTITCTRN